jgi:hypothetical protein
MRPPGIFNFGNFCRTATNPMLLCIRGQLASSATVTYECLLSKVENKIVYQGVSVKVECALPACKIWC